MSRAILTLMVGSARLKRRAICCWVVVLRMRAGTCSSRARDRAAPNAAAAGLGADVLGVEIASNLVEAGNARARSVGLTNCRFQEAMLAICWSSRMRASISSASARGRFSLAPIRKTPRRGLGFGERA